MLNSLFFYSIKNVTNIPQSKNKAQEKHILYPKVPSAVVALAVKMVVFRLRKPEFPAAKYR